MNKIAAYILAGGRSSRFGEDKARAVLDGMPLICHVAQAIAPVAGPITVIGKTVGEYEDVGLRTITDLRDGAGPLAGLEAALADLSEAGKGDVAAGEWLLLCPCDLAGLRAEWVETLMAARDETAQCVAFRGEFIEPMPGLYRANVRETVAAHLAQGRRALHAIAEDAETRFVALPHDWNRAQNINSADDLQSYKKKT